MSNVLLITNKTDVTTDFIVKELQDRDIDFYRFNTETLGDSVSITFDFYKNVYRLYDSLNNKLVDLKKVNSIYYRRPELPVIPQGLTTGESNFIRGELLNSLEGMYRVLNDASWFSNVYSIRQAENKPYQLLVANSLGFEFRKPCLQTLLGMQCNFTGITTIHVL